MIRYFSIAASTASGSNRGSTTIEPPVIDVGFQKAPPAWLSGAHTRNRISSGHSHSVRWMRSSAAPPE